MKERASQIGQRLQPIPPASLAHAQQRSVFARPRKRTSLHVAEVDVGVAQALARGNVAADADGDEVAKGREKTVQVRLGGVRVQACRAVVSEFTAARGRTEHSGERAPDDCVRCTQQLELL
jgi:hypothetical protein